LTSTIDIGKSEVVCMFHVYRDIANQIY